jgi:hypothetical protein
MAPSVNETYRQNTPYVTTVQAVDINHSSRKQLYQEEHHELAHRRWRPQQHHVLIAYADDKVNDHSDSSKKDTARHSFTIEH